MLYLLHYKLNPLITTVGDGSIFLKIYLGLQIENKTSVEGIVFIQLLQ